MATMPGRVRMSSLAEIFPHGLGDSARLMKLDTQGYECRILEGALHVLGRTASPRLQAIVAESAPDWLYSQCCRPSFLLHLMVSAFEMGSGATVACTEKYGSESTCVARPVAPSVDERLPFEKPEAAPSSDRVGALRHKMAQCRRDQANVAARWGAVSAPPLV